MRRVGLASFWAATSGVFLLCFAFFQKTPHFAHSLTRWWWLIRLWLILRKHFCIDELLGETGHPGSRNEHLLPSALRVSWWTLGWEATPESSQQEVCGMPSHSSYRKEGFFLWQSYVCKMVRLIWNRKFTPQSWVLICIVSRSCPSSGRAGPWLSPSWSHRKTCPHTVWREVFAQVVKRASVDVYFFVAGETEPKYSALCYGSSNGRLHPSQLWPGRGHMCGWIWKTGCTFCKLYIYFCLPVCSRRSIGRWWGHSRYWDLGQGVGRYSFYCTYLHMFKNFISDEHVLPL